jgi:hypothetical protein
VRAASAEVLTTISPEILAQKPARHSQILNP